MWFGPIGRGNCCRVQLLQARCHLAGRGMPERGWLRGGGSVLSCGWEADLNVRLSVMTATFGVVLATVAAVLWGISPLCFASAGRRVGSLPVALLRILMAAVVLVAVLPVYYLVGPAVFVMPS